MKELLRLISYARRYAGHLAAAVLLMVSAGARHRDDGGAGGSHPL